MYEIEKLIKETTIGGVPSGLYSLDRITNGFQKGELTILASRPYNGADAFALHIARNAAIDYKKNVVFFSLDKSSQNVTRDILKTKLNTEFIDYECLIENKATFSEFENAPIFIDDTQHLSAVELMERACVYNSERKADVIIVSCLQLLIEKNFSEAVRLLKVLASAMDVPVIVLSQLPMIADIREAGRKPMLSDLTAYGRIEKYADRVLLFYRPDYYGLNGFDDAGYEINNRLVEMIIAKNRNGGGSQSVRVSINGWGDFADIDS